MHNNSPSFMTLLLTLAAALPPVGSAFAFPSLAADTTTSSFQRHHRLNRNLVGHEHNYSTRRHSYILPTPLSSSGNDSNEGADTINIAIVASAKNAPLDTTAFREALTSHPFCQMTGIQLSIVDILLPHNNNDNNNNNVNNDDDKQSQNELTTSLQCSDIACFPTSNTVKSYLRFVDEKLNLSNDITEEERRSLPNRPPSKDANSNTEDDDGDDPVTSLETTGIMAACIDTETAKQCLNSGRWMANHIYYPKSGEAVDLKIEEGSEDNDDDVVENVEWTEEMIDLWTASVMQAAGDVMERKFWGGGW